MRSGPEPARALIGRLASVFTELPDPEVASGSGRLGWGDVPAAAGCSSGGPLDRAGHDDTSTTATTTHDRSSHTDTPTTAHDGPLGWPGYDDQLAQATERTGERESVVCGIAEIGRVTAMVVAFEFGFFGGSLGTRTGARIEQAFERARALRLPVVSLVRTGGSRMQEGTPALLQLQRIARQLVLTREAGLPHIAVLRDPTTGGGWATLGAGADVALGLRGAQVGFAGSRVRPPGYSVTQQFAAGLVDQLVPPDELRVRLERWLRLLTPAELEPAAVPAALGCAELPDTGWDAVQRARAPDRPRAAAYLAAYFDWHEPVSGDRCGGVDSGVLCGFGQRSGTTIAYAAQCGTATRPAGFRTAARLVRLADRLGIPVLTLVDTPGAANDAAAEKAGVGAAIADMFTAVAAAQVPVTTLLIGEGGSGGALAFAAPGRLWVTPDSYLAVISPELAAAILKRDPSRVRDTADQLRLRPQDLVELGIARGVARPRER
ncbi:acetyl-CoA carboxylase carboxyl transferase subunit beta [Lentzea atacamensis]|uniref:Acetyl-coenzyme A carboxylase carboxyl transferase subunits beta/alpha n=1 Tax=Lentzea atacamensis TaxID=531938 RepID=A0ABX9EGJ7_9PSEU|nr:carboxyl transferase domain-containing protein [Lentzea atacamensis]RAS70311.1 acetyl-CoA carboxylase carboxyl transferase subunit beta [Lentzea atacamensis]